VLAGTLQDAASVAWASGPGSRIFRGGAFSGGNSGDTVIFAPSGLMLNVHDAQAALKTGATGYFFAFGNQAAPPDLFALAPVLDMLIARSGMAFMAACFAAPMQGRFVFQGHLFQDGKLVANLHHPLSEELSGRVAIIPHEVIAAGPAAIRARLASCREQGIALALLDAVDPTQCEAVATALASQLLIGGPAWLAGGTQKPEPAAPEGRLAILSGALDRQTLFQLGAARAAMPFLQLDFSGADVTASALAWAAAQEENFIIAASVPPDRVNPGTPATAIMAGIAAGLATQGVKRFVLAGNDTASAILDRLAVQSLIAGAASGGLRWLEDQKYSFLIKPGAFGGRNLFLDGFEPQIRLNAAAE